MLRHTLFIISTFLFFISCSEKSSESELSILDKDRMSIDSIESKIRTSLDSAKNPSIELAMQATKAYEIFVYKYPDDSLSPNYLFKSAQIYEGMLGDKIRAAKTYKKIYDEYEAFDNRPMMLFYMGNTYHDLGDTTAAVETLELFIAKYPNHEFKDDAENLIQFIRMDESDLEKFFNKNS